MLRDQLTARQQKVFDVIVEQINKRGFAPSIREIAEQMNFSSPNGVMGHLRALEKKGFICRAQNQSRGITLTDTAQEQLTGLPLAGRVQAGALMEAIEQTERVDVAGLWPQKGTFLLQVEGDSMIDAQIASGDFVVVKRRRTAAAGDMVVARTPDGEATLKYWFPEKKRIRLQPANKKLSPIYSRDAKVIGVVIGVIRKYN